MRQTKLYVIISRFSSHHHHHRLSIGQLHVMDFLKIIFSGKSVGKFYVHDVAGHVAPPEKLNIFINVSRLSSSLRGKFKLHKIGCRLYHLLFLSQQQISDTRRGSVVVSYISH